jgi:hypothetical protein
MIDMLVKPVEGTRQEFIWRIKFVVKTKLKGIVPAKNAETAQKQKKEPERDLF